ncbi:unnamed protein product [Didymodactylos carnosus]|uniref:Uncharacterized protein n=1 Tax=Didymodactylos carnosus TaxID=1234261 RepID=A0A814USH2_9BILA|nr:unnamed protein product [Didymodactylos carnosus]CAF3942487.1 unnamed protein product [Didymodactylos carnosus]
MQGLATGLMVIFGFRAVDNLRPTEFWSTNDFQVGGLPSKCGSIYINTGIEEPNQLLSGLIHTKQTIEQLELLTAACQSKSAILLEGDICSRKSVIELAHVTRNHLIVIPLHENFKTSDLIGTWLPSTVDTRDNTLFVYASLNSVQKILSYSDF